MTNFLIILLATAGTIFVLFYTKKVEQQFRRDAERKCYDVAYLSDMEIHALKKFRSRTNRYWKTTNFGGRDFRDTEISIQDDIERHQSDVFSRSILWSTTVVTGLHAMGIAGKKSVLEVLYFYYGDAQEAEMTEFLDEYEKNSTSNIRVIPVKVVTEGTLVEYLKQETKRNEALLRARAYREEMGHRFRILADYLYDHADDVESALVQDFICSEESEWSQLANTYVTSAFKVI